jgi:hypothetical protein
MYLSLPTFHISRNFEYIQCIRCLRTCGTYIANRFEPGLVAVPAGAAVVDIKLVNLSSKSRQFSRSLSFDRVSNIEYEPDEAPALTAAVVGCAATAAIPFAVQYLWKMPAALKASTVFPQLVDAHDDMASLMESDASPMVLHWQDMGVCCLPLTLLEA